MYVVLILNKYKYSKYWNGFTISTSCGGTRTEAIDTMKFGSCSARSGWTVCWSGAGLGVYYIYMNEHLYKYLDEMLLQFTFITNDRDEYLNAFWFCSSVIDSSKEKYFVLLFFFYQLVSKYCVLKFFFDELSSQEIYIAFNLYQFLKLRMQWRWFCKF